MCVAVLWWCCVACVAVVLCDMYCGVAVVLCRVCWKATRVIIIILVWYFNKYEILYCRCCYFFYEREQYPDKNDQVTYKSSSKQIQICDRI